MTIAAKVVAHSRVTGAPDLITLQLRYPRFIHAEFMTHRVFSRNASSSRAIPIERMIQDVIDDPAMPVAWGSNKPGMQAGAELTGSMLELAQRSWQTACRFAIHEAKNLAAVGAHKQIVNRLLEPFAHISVVVTATEWQNFFALRCHPDADPTMRALAEAMRDAIKASEPNDWIIGDWHLPYVDAETLGALYARHKSDSDGTMRMLAMISAARCARVSYLNHDGSNPDLDKDLALARRLLESKHMSPFEHQAQVMGHGVLERAFQGNFVRWKQHRKMIEVQQ